MNPFLKRYRLILEATAQAMDEAGVDAELRQKTFLIISEKSEGLEEALRQAEQEWKNEWDDDDTPMKSTGTRGRSRSAASVAAVP